MKKIKRLGRGLNEGYTQLLTNSYSLSAKNMLVELYTMDIVEKLEEVIGREKMWDLYFNGNIFHIIGTLIELSSYEETQQFIKGLDLLFALYSKNGFLGSQS